MQLLRRVLHQLHPDLWLRLILVGLATFYMVFVLFYVFTGGLFDYLGIDYRAFRASAEIVRDRGFGPLYDLQVQEEYQRRLYNAHIIEPGHVPYATAPLYYPPIFVLPFLPLLALKPLPSFIVWTGLNAVGFFFYLRWFLKQIGCNVKNNILLKTMLCLPFFSNLFLGQVNVILAICVGQFLLACRRQKDLAGGGWLSGLLLKFQTLVILGPGLVISRRWKALLGVVLAGLLILAVSVALVGIPGMIDLGNLYLRSSAAKDPTTHPEAMMNWRSLAINLAGVLPKEVTWGIAIAGLVATALVALAFWIRPGPANSSRFALVLLGTYAATATVAWHSHTHMALPMVPLLLLLYAEKKVSSKFLDIWLVVPSLAFIGAMVVWTSKVYQVAGLTMLALNLYLVIWVARELWGRTRYDTDVDAPRNLPDAQMRPTDLDTGTQITD